MDIDIPLCLRASGAHTHPLLRLDGNQLFRCSSSTSLSGLRKFLSKYFLFPSLPPSLPPTKWISRPAPPPAILPSFPSSPLPHPTFRNPTSTPSFWYVHAKQKKNRGGEWNRLTKRRRGGREGGREDTLFDRSIHNGESDLLRQQDGSKGGIRKGRKGA